MKRQEAERGGSAHAVQWRLASPTKILVRRTEPMIEPPVRMTKESLGSCGVFSRKRNAALVKRPGPKAFSESLSTQAKSSGSSGVIVVDVIFRLIEKNVYLQAHQGDLESEIRNYAPAAQNSSSS